MRFAIVKAAALVMVGGALAPVAIHADEPLAPSVELQSSALTPGLSLAESTRPVHQVRLLADVGRPGVSRGLVILDPNAPIFDEFGELVGGIDTPMTDKAKRGSQRAVKLECSIEPIKTGRGERAWHLYRLAGPAIQTPLRLATLGPVTSSGSARLLVLGKSGNAEFVIAMTRYGLIPP